MPLKTALTILTFSPLIRLPQIAPALKNYQSLDPHNIPLVWDLPLPKLKTATVEAAVKPTEVKPPSNLIDPQHSLDHFYEALLKNGTTRIIHYGDSPTTGDLITADARAMLQHQFGDAGSGFVLIARPWAWYNRRGVEMDASKWKIDIAGIAQLKDGMHGLGGVSFLGSPGATAHWKLRTGQHSVVEIAYLKEPGAGAFEVLAEDKTLGEIDTSGDFKSAAHASFKVPQGA